MADCKGAGPTDVSVKAHDGIVLRGKAFGRANSRPVVFLHGGGQSQSAWHGAAELLGKAEFLAVSMNLRGHGDSDWSPTANYTFDDYADDLASTVKSFGNRAAVVGASLGGHVATVAAARHPDRVSAIALADVTPWLDEGTTGIAIRAAMRRMGAGAASLEEAAQFIADVVGGEPRRDLNGLARHLRHGDDGRWYWRWDPAFLTEDNLRHAGEGGLFARCAASLRCPVLVMRAARSTVTSDVQVERFRAAVPWLQTVMIPGLDHMLTGDANDAYAPEILRFLTSQGLQMS